MQEPRTSPSLPGPIAISLAAGIIVLLGGLFVNGCRISKLLSRSSSDPGEASIVVTPPAVVDSALVGATVPRVTSLDVSNGGTWFATAGTAWMSVNPTRGGSRATVRLSLDPKNLTPGLHLGTIALQHDSGGPRTVVAVSFRIQQPILAVTPGSLSYTPHTSNSVFYDTLQVTNEGDGPLAWTASTEHHVGWLTLTNTSGTAPGKIVVRATNEGLAFFGTFQETIIVTASGAKNSPQRIDVTLKRRKHDDDVIIP